MDPNMDPGFFVKCSGIDVTGSLCACIIIGRLNVITFPSQKSVYKLSILGTTHLIKPAVVKYC
jgi:hypothetical protein